MTIFFRPVASTALTTPAFGGSGIGLEVFSVCPAEDLSSISRAARLVAASWRLAE